MKRRVLSTKVVLAARDSLVSRKAPTADALFLKTKTKKICKLIDRVFFKKYGTNLCCELLFLRDVSGAAGR